MVLYCYDGHFANQNSPQLPAHIYCYKSCEAQGKNVLLHLENLMLNGWNVLKWGGKKKKQLFYDAFDPHLVQYRQDTIQKAVSHRMEVSEEIKQILIFLSLRRCLYYHNTSRPV